MLVSCLPSTAIAIPSDNIMERCFEVENVLMGVREEAKGKLILIAARFSLFNKQFTE